MNDYIFETPVGEIQVPAANKIAAYETFAELYPELVKESDIIRVISY